MYKGELVFATNNLHKLSEAQQILPAFVKIKILAKINCSEELPETHDTLEENALEKANFIWEKFKLNCFSEDTGLEVDALNGAPGAFSARFSGMRDPERNMNFLLEQMKIEKNRAAQFRTVIALAIEGKR